jgi:hypothetical protein
MGKRRADSLQAFVGRCWRAVCDGLRYFQKAHERAVRVPRWKHLIERGQVIDHGGGIGYRRYGSARMEQAACFGESDAIDAARFAFTSFDPGGEDYTGYCCAACEKEKVKTHIDRAEQVKLNKMAHDYKADQLPNHEQIRYDVGWLTGLVIRLSAQLDKANKEK